jgi:hypothetical protein
MNSLSGITLADEQGKHPKGPCTRQFNFKFSLNEDMYAQVSSVNEDMYAQVSSVNEDMYAQVSSVNDWDSRRREFTALGELFFPGLGRFSILARDFEGNY